MTDHEAAVMLRDQVLDLQEEVSRLELERIELVRERDEARAELLEEQVLVGNINRDWNRMLVRAEAAEARAAVLATALKDCADDLEAEVEARYPAESSHHPSEARRRWRDMEPVRKARAALQDAGGAAAEPNMLLSGVQDGSTGEGDAADGEEGSHPPRVAPAGGSEHPDQARHPDEGHPRPEQ